MTTRTSSFAASSSLRTIRAPSSTRKTRRFSAWSAVSPNQSSPLSSTASASHRSNRRHRSPVSTLSREELRRALKQGRIDPLYLLFGAESYLRDLAARAITEAVLRDAPLREFNEATFSLASADVQQAIAAAEQLPMIASRRVVRITDFSRLQREADEAALMRYVARPVESTTLIFIADELDKRRKLSKMLLDVCTAVEFAPLADAELAKWARDHLKPWKAEMDERSLHQLVALVGSDVRTLSHDLDKLATAALPTGRIPMEMIEDLTGRSRELSNFELTDPLIARNRQRAL